MSVAVRPGSSFYWPGPAAAYAAVATDLATDQGWPEYVLPGLLAGTVVADAAWHPDSPPDYWSAAKDWIGLGPDADDDEPGKPTVAGWLGALAHSMAEGGEPDDAPGWLALCRAVVETADAAEAAGDATAGRKEWVMDQLRRRLDLATPANAADIQSAAAGSVGRASVAVEATQREAAASFTADPLAWLQANPVKTAGYATAGLMLAGFALNPAGAVMALKALVRR